MERAWVISMLESQSLQPMQVLPCPTQWGWTENDIILGQAAALLLKSQKCVGNSRVAAKGFPSAQKLTFSARPIFFCYVSCQYEQLTNLPTRGYIYLYDNMTTIICCSIVCIVLSCNTHVSRSKINTKCLNSNNNRKNYFQSPQYS